MKGWSKYIFNIDTIFIFIIIIVVVYCIFTNKLPKGRSTGINTEILPNLDIHHKYQKSVSKNIPKRKQKFNKHEERCRQVFQDIYKTQFKTIRPDWLKNPATGKNLELDGYSPDIKTHIGKGLAFEYDGVQHSKYNKHFHRSGPKEFIYQVKKDEWKDAVCKKKGILLIRIPHFIIYEDIERYITNKLRKFNLLPSNHKSKRFEGLAHNAQNLILSKTPVGDGTSSYEFFESGNFYG